MRKYLSAVDLSVLKDALITSPLGLENGVAPANLRFLEYIGKNGMPENLLVIRQVEGCGGGGQLSVRTPALQVRILLVENVAPKPLDIGDFSVRRLVSESNKAMLRGGTETQQMLSNATLQSIPLFGPRVLAPGEKLVIPLEMRLSYDTKAAAGDLEDDEESEYNEQDQKRAEAAVIHNRTLQTVHITTKVVEQVTGSNGKEDYKERLVRVASISKSDLLAGLKQPRPRIKTDNYFVFGTSMNVEAVTVNGKITAITKYDPKYVSLISGYEGGSCPVVYCLDSGKTLAPRRSHSDSPRRQAPRRH